MFDMLSSRGAEEATADRVARQKRAEHAERVAAGAETLEHIRKHPIFAEAQAQARASQIAARTTLRARIAQIEATFATARRELSDTAKQAEAEAEELERKAKAARRRASDARAAMLVASSSASASRSRAEYELCDTADPAIAAFIDEMRGMMDAERRTVRGEERDGPKRGGAVMHFVVGNASSIQLRHLAVRQAIASAEAMKLQADQGDVAARLNALRAGFPPIEDEIGVRPQVEIIADRGRNSGRYRDVPVRERSIFGRSI